MKHILKRFAVLLLCAVMLLSVNSYVNPYNTVDARSVSEIKDDISDYEDELDSYNNEIGKYQDILSELSSELSYISNNIEALEAQSGQTRELLMQYQAEIEGLQIEIETNEMILENYDFKRAQVVAEKAVAQEDYDYRVSMYKKLMQFIYENGDTNAFELLFSSENFSDYLTRRDNFNDIMNAANDLIKEIEVSIDELSTLDAEYAEAQAKYDEHLTQLNQAKIDKEARVREFETIAAELDLDVAELSAEYSEQNTKVSEISGKLKQLKSDRETIKNKITELKEELKKAQEQSKPNVTVSAPSMSGFVWPVSASYYVMTSYFGWRSDPFTGEQKYHNGHDIACSRGTPILASKGGVVTMASYFGGYGNCVIIYHGNGISTLYAHCDWATSSRPMFEVSVGDTVETGEVIAYVGTSGRSTGYHLHFGVMTNTQNVAFSGVYVDPDLYLPEGYC